MYKPYYLLVQALHVSHEAKHIELCGRMVQNMEAELLLPRVVFNGARTFRLNVKVNRYNIRYRCNSI